MDLKSVKALQTVSTPIAVSIGMQRLAMRVDSRTIVSFQIHENLIPKIISDRVLPFSTGCDILTLHTRVVRGNRGKLTGACE